jgi:hypothetical protein
MATRKASAFTLHPCFHMHFTRTSASWLIAVETLFAALSKRRLKRAVFRSALELNQPRLATTSPATTPTQSPVHLDRARRYHHRQTPAGQKCWDHSTS